MKKLAFLFSLLMLWGAYSYGQIANVNKLQRQLPLIHDSLRYADALNRLGILYYERNVDSSFLFTEKARNISKRHDYAKGEADAANNLGIVYNMKGNLQLALRYYNEGYNRYQAIHDSANVVQALMNIAMTYQELGKDNKAINEYKLAIAHGKTLSHDSIMSLVWYNYLIMYPAAFKKDSLTFYINKATKIAAKYKDERVLMAIEQLRADTYIANGSREAGIALLQKAAADALKNNLNYLSLDILIELGDLYADNDSSKAVGYYKEGLDISERKEYRVYVDRLSKKLYTFYSAHKDIAKAFYYSQKLVNIHDEQEKLNNTSGIDYIEYALKDQQLDSARVQSRNELWFLVLAGIVILLTAVVLAVLWRNWNKLRKTSEALRLQFERSESTTEALDVMNKNYARLIKIVAHDLRNPISAISTISTMLQPDENLPGDIKELIDIVQVSSKNSLNLINELMNTDFGHEQSLKFEVIKAGELLSQCTNLLRFRANDKDQHLLLKGNADVEIEGDREKLWRVINNLIVNAIKFSPNGSTITVASREQNGFVLISVKDRGLGIPNDMRDRIFDPFTAARRTGTDGEQPFGLGLYISKQIVEAHKGEIWFESALEKGTTFYVKLPLTSTMKQKTASSTLAF